MYQQRAAPEDQGAHPAGPWPVPIHFVDGSSEVLVPGGEDWYVAIDDLAFGRVVFDAAPWPHLDGLGRLAFESTRETRVVDLDDAQQVVDAARARHAQEIRPLRIGDVFLVQGPDLPDDVSDWRIGADVTRAARDAAKLALFAAVAPKLSPSEEDMLADLPAEPDIAPDAPGGGHSFPAV